METITPGLQPDMTNDAYQAHRGISKSKLDHMAEKAPVHYWDRHINPDRPEEERTEALIVGDAIHAAIGEPDTVSSRFIVIPDDAPKRPSKTQLNAKNPSLDSRGAIEYWKGFTEEHAGKVILKPDQMALVLACRDSAWGDPLIRSLLTGSTSEQTYFAIDHETGELLKCRLDGDRLDQGLILDIKSTEDASEDAFDRSVKKYRYDVQDGWYTDVVNQAIGAQVVEGFAFIAIEKTRPYAAAVHYLPYDRRMDGYDKARRDLKRIISYTERFGAEKWPSYTENGPTELRSWRDRQNQS
jgi:exodeoxyribonuclease VIII